MVTISNKATVKTDVKAILQCLANLRSTRACLTCTARINFHEHAPGTFSLVREFEKESRPSSVVDGLREHPASESPYVQIFGDNQSVLIHQTARQVVVKTGSLILNMRVDALKHKHGLTSAIRTLLASRYAPLCDSQGTLGVPIVAGIFNRLSRAQGGEVGQANIDADHVRVERKRRGFNLANKDGKPTASLALDGKGFDYPFDWTRDLNLYVSNFGDAEIVVNGTRSGVLSKRHRVVAVCRSKTRVAWFLTRLNTTKESLERKVNTLQNIFKHYRIKRTNIVTAGADLFHLRGLRIVTTANATQLPRITALLQSRVEQFRAYSELIVKRLRLALGWINAVTEDFNHLFILTRITETEAGQ